MKRSIFFQKQVYVLDADKRIMDGLRYIFRDVLFEEIEESACFLDDAIIDCRKKESDPENGRVGLRYYLNKANYLYNISDRKIVLWGSGNRGKQAVELWHSLYPELEISFIVDSAPEKSKICDSKVQIQRPDVLEKKQEDLYIVVCVDNDSEITSSLENWGYHKGKDYASWRTVFENLGELLYKTLTAQRKHSFVCKRPFGFVDIIRSDVYLCCPASMRAFSIGNIEENEFNNVWHSTKANIVRLSILNGSYIFCDEKFCDRYDLTNNNEDDSDREEPYSYEDECPRDMLLGFDASCNLSCPSCRRGLFVETDEQIERKWNLADDFLQKYSGKTERIWLSGDGEVFFSKLYRRMLDHPALKSRRIISILSNGMLMNKLTWERYLDTYKSVDVVVSIDGATKETYEKLRRGGKFEVICANLEFLGDMRKQGIIESFQINFVLQSENIKELALMAEWGRKLNVDTIKIIKFYDYGLNVGEGNATQVVVDETCHSLKPEYEAMITRELLDDPIFDWSFMGSYIGVKPKKSLFSDGYSLW